MARATWKSKFGFLMAAAGSAIGLGNIVFFPANAYKYGGGAFYIPYLIAMVFLGLPIIVMELGIGRIFAKGLPETMRKTAGFKGEMTGWFAILNSSVITMYYITILAWVLGMLFLTIGPLWQGVPVPEFGLTGSEGRGMTHFFDIITNYKTLLLVVTVWIINILAIWRGTKTIEKIVKVLVPTMWIMMFVIIFRGLTMEGGFEGLMLLFTPDLSILSQVDVWKGAFSQIFFTLSLGFGIMTTYASYLPKKSDVINDGISVTFMNCTFEMIAGIAIFTLLFVFSIAPKASSISMMFFIMPDGIAQFPDGTVIAFGILFFSLLFMAGITSSISLLETAIAAITDKFALKRSHALLIVFAIGTTGSIFFALPTVIDAKLAVDGTLGLTLLDILDHWAFSNGLLLAGLIETILIGWVFGAEKLRNILNETSSWHLGVWFDILIKYFIPIALIFILGSGLIKEFSGLYPNKPTGVHNLEYFALLFWLIFTIGGSFILAKMKGENHA
ncbi:sodium-dependent transporter [bacterium]|nr:sodium-dependent transporter [bacterium]